MLKANVRFTLYSGIRSALGAVREQLGAERVRREMAETTLREGMWRKSNAGGSVTISVRSERPSLRRENRLRRARSSRVGGRGSTPLQ